jgi:hypothetical protein
MWFVNLRQHRTALREGWNCKQGEEQALKFQDPRQRNPPARHTTPKKQKGAASPRPFPEVFTAFLL